MGVLIEAYTVHHTPFPELGKSARTIQEPNHDY